MMVKDPQAPKGQRRWKLLLAALCAAGLLAGCWVWWTFRRYQRAMEDIQSEIVAGRYAIACRKIDELLSWNTDPTGEISYLLGSCELARAEPTSRGGLGAHRAGIGVLPESH